MKFTVNCFSHMEEGVGSTVTDWGKCKEEGKEGTKFLQSSRHKQQRKIR